MKRNTKIGIDGLPINPNERKRLSTTTQESTTQEDTMTEITTPAKLDISGAAESLNERQHRVLMDIGYKSRRLADEIQKVQTEATEALERRAAGQRFGWGGVTNDVFGHQLMADVARLNTELEGLVQTALLLDVPSDLIQSAYAHGDR